MKKYKAIPVLTLLLLLMAGPILYHLLPQYYLTPDILYVKAKTMWVASGDLYTDPASGFPTFHPPYYHLFLSWFVRLGIHIDSLLITISLLNVALLLLFAYLLLRKVFDDTTVLVTLLLLPFINRYMGPDYLFLASSFSFSVPFFLAGLWLYLKEDPTVVRSILTSVLWGCAFLVSPGYLFLIAFTFAYELLFKRRFTRFGVMASVFLITILPFFYQANTIRKLGMLETSTFSLWRGFPGFDWLQSLVVNFLSLTDGRLTHWHLLPLVVLAGLGLIEFWYTRPRHPFPAIAALAYLFTFYHFNEQYSSRILIFLSLFLTAYAIRFLLSIELRKRLILVLISLFVLLSLGDHVMRMVQFYNKRMDRFALYDQQEASIMAGLAPHVKPGEFILAGAKTYRRYIMPNIPAHGLLAYKTGEYYQLNTTLAKDMLLDYSALMEADNRETIRHICNKYGIKIAVMSKKDHRQSVFRVLPQWWELLYEDGMFKIYQRPI